MYAPFELPETTAMGRVNELIVQHLDPVAIYCIGFSRKHYSFGSALPGSSSQDSEKIHFYFLVFVKRMRDNTGADVADIVRNVFDGQCRVTLLVHTLKSLKQKPGDQQCFFYEAIRHGTLVYRSDAPLPFMELATPPVRDMEAAQRYWSSRVSVATTLLRCAEDVDESEPVAAKAMLLHLVTEHICLGLIRVFLGYRPNHFALDFLMDLCTQFTTLGDVIFPRESAADKGLFKLLCTNATQLRFKNGSYSDGIDVALLERCCSLFLTEAVLLVVREFDNGLAELPAYNYSTTRIVEDSE